MSLFSYDPIFISMINHVIFVFLIFFTFDILHHFVQPATLLVLCLLWDVWLVLDCFVGNLILYLFRSFSHLLDLVLIRVFILKVIFNGFAFVAAHYNFEFSFQKNTNSKIFDKLNTHAKAWINGKPPLFPWFPPW